VKKQKFQTIWPILREVIVFVFVAVGGLYAIVIVLTMGRIYGTW
jgi:hypothetical protein